MRDTAYNRKISNNQWIRSGQQRRGKKTQGKLLDAAQELFLQKGIANSSIADVARKAQCSVGAVYHHFSDKEAMIYALFERTRGEIQKQCHGFAQEDRWNDAPLSEIVEAYIHFSLATPQSFPLLRLIRSDITLSHALSHQLVEAEFDTIFSTLEQRVAQLLLIRSVAITHADPPLAIRFVLEQISCMTANRAKDPSSSERLSEEAFTNELLRSVLGYLMPVR